MRRIHCFCLTGFLLLAGSVQADLVVQDYLGNGQQVVLDTVTGYHWYRNLNDFTNMTYEMQIDAISDLGSYGNISGGWHMATLTEMETLWACPESAIAGVFPRTDLWVPHPYGDTYARYEEVCPWTSTPSHFMGIIYRDHFTGVLSNLVPLSAGGIQDDLMGHWAAWVVTAAPVVTVPTPSAVLLAATGLLSSTRGLKRLRRKRQE